jgi:DNA-binding NtrC family response regulator
VSDSTILIVSLSHSFADLWPQLAADLGVKVRFAEAGNGCGVPRDTAAVVVAAGGAEREVLQWFESHCLPVTTPVLAVGSDPGRRITAQLVGRGARDYFALPEDLELLRNTLQLAVSCHREKLRQEDGAMPEAAAAAFAGIVGQSPALKAALKRAARVLPHADATALIVGDTGTGKELLARAIHRGGRRRGGAFVTVNCSALPANLIESELFGHERGAFTDAHAAKPGLFEVADGGTLFLDEIDMLTVDLQAKLLRVLEDKEVRRVGATRSRTVDVRIIAATHEDLREAVAAGKFREDLYFRLSVITLTLPPLRERGEDVILIAQELLQRLAAQHGVAVPPLGVEARRALRAHSWPGNVRELKNAVERALLLSPPGELSLAELLPEGSVTDRGNGKFQLPESLDELAATAARATLEQCGGNRSEAARRLSISRQRLRRLLGGGAAAVTD